MEFRVEAFGLFATGSLRVLSKGIFGSLSIVYGALFVLIAIQDALGSLNSPHFQPPIGESSGLACRGSASRNGWV